MGVKEVYTKWESINLVYRILGGLLIGLVLALIIPGNNYIPILGNLFISALKAIAPFLVLFLVIGSLSKSGKGIGPRFKLVLYLYVISTIIAAIIATAMSFGFPVDIILNIAPEDMSGSPAMHTNSSPHFSESSSATPLKH